MCTATFIRDKGNRIIFTTNRDEHAVRPTAPPKVHTIGELKLLFPQDQLAGGTWVAVSETGLIGCLLNGAEGEYEWRGKTAEKSRGQVLLDSFLYENTAAFMAEDSFKKAHPFTLLRIHPANDIIHTLKWNGTKKWLEEFDSSKPQIWSAYTLYPAEQRNERDILFHKWAKDNRNLHAKALWQLHQSSKENNGLLLQGNKSVNTVSTTQLILDQQQCIMSYYEMEPGIHLEESLEIK